MVSTGECPADFLDTTLTTVRWEKLRDRAEASSDNVDEVAAEDGEEVEEEGDDEEEEDDEVSTEEVEVTLWMISTLTREHQRCNELQ
eukprot:COSAG06_NODE_4917_length_3859_cov_2.785638_5_plen_87_part_00